MVEGVSRTASVGPVAVSETRIIGRDQMVVVRKPRKEWLKHPRRRRKTVQQKNVREHLLGRLPDRRWKAHRQMIVR